jgi:DNA-binding NarL/FixJ family response regulator
MRVILADDQPEVRSALRLLLEDRPGIIVVGEASTTYELISQVRAGNLDLLILDWELPGTNPRELIPLLQTIHPQLSIIALSARPQVRRSALEAGAREFICKSDPPEMLLTTINRYAENRG